MGFSLRQLRTMRKYLLILGVLLVFFIGLVIVPWFKVCYVRGFESEQFDRRQGWILKQESGCFELNIVDTLFWSKQAYGWIVSSNNAIEVITFEEICSEVNATCEVKLNI